MRIRLSRDRHHIALSGRYLGFPSSTVAGLRQLEENAMTEGELVSLRAQVMQLQQQAEHRAQAWLKLGRICGGLALTLALMALGFIVAGVWFHLRSSPTAEFAQMASSQLLFASLPLGLLAQALRMR
jgi:hypothetical protein